jgi:hypothetical protein
MRPLPPLLALALLAPITLLACGGEPVKSASAPTPTPTPAGPPQAHDGPPMAHSGLPADHPPIGANGAPPMMPAMPAAAPAGPPQNPREVTPTGEVRAETVAGLSFNVPVEWTSRPPASAMRLAELVLPGPGGDTALVLYRFPGGAGGVDANIARWKGQFTAPEGKSIDELSTVVTQTRAPLTITRLDVRGTLTAETTPGAGDRQNADNSRLLAAIVEGVGDPFFLKAVGPAATLDLWDAAFVAMVDSLAPAS